MLPISRAQSIPTSCRNIIGGLWSAAHSFHLTEPERRNAKIRLLAGNDRVRGELTLQELTVCGSW